MKRLILIILSLVLLAGAMFLFLFVRGDGKISFETVRSLFPESATTELENSDDTSSENDDDETSSFPERSEPVFRYKQLFSKPVSGFIHLSRGGGIVRFMEQETGHIYDYGLETGNLEKVSNKTIPGTREVLWESDGESFVVRSLNATGEIENRYYSFKKDGDNARFLFEFKTDLKQGDRKQDVKYLQATLNADPDTRVALSGPGSPGAENDYFGPATKKAVATFQEKYKNDLELIEGPADASGIVGPRTREKLTQINTGLFEEKPDDEFKETELLTTELPPFLEVTENPEKNKIFYLEPADNRVRGVSSNFEGGGKIELFSSTLSEWLIDWHTGTGISFVSKPSQGIPGSLFLLDTKTKGFAKTLGGVAGMTALTSPDGNKILYAQNISAGNGFNLFLKNIKMGEVISILLQTLPEKCAWANDAVVIFCGVPKTLPRGEYPDHWYQGRFGFEDEIWMFDTDTYDSALLFDPELETITGSIDATELLLSADEKYLLFKNRNDGTPWSLRLGGMENVSSGN